MGLVGAVGHKSVWQPMKQRLFDKLSARKGHFQREVIYEENVLKILWTRILLSDLPTALLIIFEMTCCSDCKHFQCILSDQKDCSNTTFLLWTAFPRYFLDLNFSRNLTHTDLKKSFSILEKNREIKTRTKPTSWALKQTTHQV